jgi:hypothetical protein
MVSFMLIRYRDAEDLLELAVEEGVGVRNVCTGAQLPWPDVDRWKLCGDGDADAVTGTLAGAGTAVHGADAGEELLWVAGAGSMGAARGR